MVTKREREEKGEKEVGRKRRREREGGRWTKREEKGKEERSEQYNCTSTDTQSCLYLFFCQWDSDSASLVTSIPSATSHSISFLVCLTPGSLVVLMARGKAASSLWVQSINGSYTNASSSVSNVSLPRRRIRNISSHDMRNKPCQDNTQYNYSNTTIINSSKNTVHSLQLVE